MRGWKEEEKEKGEKGEKGKEVECEGKDQRLGEILCWNG